MGVSSRIAAPSSNPTGPRHIDAASIASRSTSPRLSFDSGSSLLTMYFSSLPTHLRFC